MRNLPQLLTALGGLLMISWVLYTVVNGLRLWHQQRMLSQFQTKLLDRIGSVSELGAFLNTDAGGQFLKGLTTMSESAGPQLHILRAVQSGVVLTTLASGLYAYGWMTPIGVGLLISAAVSCRLSKRLVLLSGDEPSR